ncbi:MAG: GNAT family N-acetyltransferase [Planctomycetota bacterium]
MSRSIEIKELSEPDAPLLESFAADVFDDAIDIRRANEFLADPRHHLVAALADGRVVGFASAVHYVHPDKPTPEMWVNELGVDPAFRRQGLATSILSKLSEIAARLGCCDVWVLTERGNTAAMELYGSIPGSQAKDAVMFTFPVRFRDGGT